MVGVSDKALSEFKKVLSVEENKGLGIKIRASVSQSSCCSCGPSQSYEMDLVANGEAGDIEMGREGVNIYVDSQSAELMNGMEVDFIDDHGFIVKDNNPSSCGCGGGDDHGHGGSCCG